MLIHRQQSSRAGRSYSPLRILLVEDDTGTASAMQRILERAGFHTRAVGSYRGAIHLATQWIPDVLVADVGLPGKDGVQLMETMRIAYPGLKGLVISGFAAPEDVARSHAAGFHAHLAKPVSPDQLIAAIREVCGSEEKVDGDRVEG